MFHEIEPHRFYNQFDMKREPRPTDFRMIFRGRDILLKGKPGEEELPRCDGADSENLTYLISVDDTAYFLEEPDEETLNRLLATGCFFSKTKVLRTMRPKWQAYGAVTAYHLADWYAKTRFCGACGGPMKKDEKERAMRCPACGNIVYPRINPGVIVRVTHGDKILLTKYAGRDFTNYALIAGFTEIGETLEQTVEREVMEEVGVRVKNIRYYKNQPWQFSQSLLVGFTAELDGEDEHITLEEDELSIGVWMTREEMPDRAGDISLTAEMMENFRRGIC